METLDHTFGNRFTVLEALRRALEHWGKISPSDSEELRRFSDFINQCVSPKETIPELGILDDGQKLKNLAQLLPSWDLQRWSHTASVHKQKYDEYPKLREFTSFLTLDAELANDAFSCSSPVCGIFHKELSLL